VSRTLREGLLGMDVCVGGGAREDDVEEGGRRFGRGERDGGGGMREEDGERDGSGARRGGARAPPNARWAEFAAGKDGAGGESSSLNAVTVQVVVDDALARGVVGDAGVLNDGRGGGGMVLRSWSSFVLAFLSGLIITISFSSPLVVFAPSWLMMAGFLVASMEDRWRLNHSTQGR
jgi:hypothetical protein